jgi:hypothetical protein
MFHGVPSNIAGHRLHEIKKNRGISANVELLFDLTGNVFDPDTLEWIGCLTRDE